MRENATVVVDGFAIVPKVESRTAADGVVWVGSARIVASNGRTLMSMDLGATQFGQEDDALEYAVTRALGELPGLAARADLVARV